MNQEKSELLTFERTENDLLWMLDTFKIFKLIKKIHPKLTNIQFTKAVEFVKIEEIKNSGNKLNSFTNLLLDQIKKILYRDSLRIQRTNKHEE